MDGNVHRKNQERYLPLYEAKLFHQYDHRFATFEGVDERALRGGKAREMTPVEKADPEAVVIPRYWVPESEVDKRLDKQDEINDTFLAEQSRAEQSRAEQSRAEQSRAEQSRALSRTPHYYKLHKSANNYGSSRYSFGLGQGTGYPYWRWNMALRLITNSTNQRTVVGALIPRVALGHKAAVMTARTGLYPLERQLTQPTNEPPSYHSVGEQE